MRRDPRAYLRDVIDAGTEIAGFIAGIKLETYTETTLIRSATERQLEIVGEALNRLSRHDPGLAARIPDLGQVVAFRNVIAHGYDVVDDGLVWRVITEDLPQLVDRAKQLLDELDQTS